VLDLYDHYAWRVLLKEHPDIFGKPLATDDKWQERYILGADVKSPELRFWLSAASGGSTSTSATSTSATSSSAASSSGKPPRKPGTHRVTTKPSNGNGTRKTTRKKTSGKRKSTPAARTVRKFRSAKPKTGARSR